MDLNNCNSEKKIKAVAFDIDGTLYPSWRLYPKIIFHFFRNCIFYLHYGIIRKKLRRIDVQNDFYKTQAEYMAERIKQSAEESHSKIVEVCYDGIGKYFKAIKPYDHIEETFRVFHEAGLKLGILSDFPPEQKGDIWGCASFADVCISSEETGALKPNSKPFEVLAEKLNVPAEEVLYVGNNHEYDIIGAKKAGMQAALIMSPVKRFFSRDKNAADFTFSNFRELQEFVLKK